MLGFEVQTNSAHLGFEVVEGKIALTRVNTNDLRNLSDELKKNLQITEVQVTGLNFHHKGISFVDTNPGRDLQYVSHTVEDQDDGKLVTIVQKNVVASLSVVSYYRLFDETAVIRSWSEIKNIGTEDLGIEYVSSFAMTGINQSGDLDGNYAEHNTIYIPNNDWTAEAQWKSQTLKDGGLDYWVDGEKNQASTKRISVNNNSSWSCSEYSPNGILTNTVTKQSAIWQIENNGAWHYELTDIGKGNLLAIRLSGPEELDNHWWKNLKVGESFTTVTVAFGQLHGDYEDAIGEMTKYRRLIRRDNEDDKKLAVIFNDYMNGLAGNPTTDTEIPLIDAANKVGCEYFVIDCGWYAPGYWWDSVGEWKPSAERFPDGIEKLIQYIRNKDMIPGLWLEIEVVGINSPLADQLPDSWFFTRHGKRVIDADRYHLDFTNPEVQDFANGIVKRLVEEYGVGYIKMDYNITTGIGTEQNADSFGDGLLNHNRAYLDWLDAIFVKYPDLVIENCGSGGMRHDYAMLERHSIQSMTDQTDYVRNGNIAAVGASVVTPEQCAIWSYPLQDGDDEEVIFNMVNSMLLRIHQSGYLNKVKGHRLELVTEGIKTYKTYRHQISTGLPIWPSGLSQLDDPWFSYGFKNKNEVYLAVWRGISQDDNYTVPLVKYGKIERVEQVYPQVDTNTSFDFDDETLSLSFSKNKVARLYRVGLEK
ncbi:alpha-galactosidase [Levilactobacillus brevis]|uniref:Alpha-galactosidase n=1 Tax=Levilactobacillus brevis TaxID=1580 RepID=A0AAJ5FKZ6_LEVBR|nr:alpha-galactosidase [Levilactobacillus brevis]AWP46162.1 alpha-galactosidase [Levilactobacillus brevis]RAY10107.1 alpha-galactosidase [Levilactobacillus brevis]TOZ06017.1 alpha-galactosidase [Levilactobacillus brevis]